MDDVKRLGSGNSSYMDINPEAVYCFGEVPPEISEYTFWGYDGELHVPAGAMAAYFSAPYWCNFANIIPDAVPPESLTLDCERKYIKFGEQFALHASVAPAVLQKDLNWLSSDTAVATVDAHGVVTAIAPGEAVIAVSFADKWAVCEVTVTDDITFVEIDKHSLALDRNELATLSVLRAPADKPVLWRSTDSGVAAVRDVNGLVQVLGVKPGTADIVAYTAEEWVRPDTCHVTVGGLRGDVNYSGMVDIDDLNLLVNIMLDKTNGTRYPLADVDGSDIVDVDDVNLLINIMLGKE